VEASTDPEAEAFAVMAAESLVEAVEEMTWAATIDSDRVAAVDLEGAAINLDRAEAIDYDVVEAINLDVMEARDSDSGLWSTGTDSRSCGEGKLGGKRSYQVACDEGHG
jgi:hypothetical protein